MTKASTQVSETPEQAAMTKAQTAFFTGTVEPAYQNTLNQQAQLYQGEIPYVTNAAQNLAGVAGQAQNVLGSAGQNALTSGVNALQNIASPQYQQQQIQAALLPAQAQYAQNIANQGAQFGSSGQLGSTRQALAGQALAGSTQAQQESAVAQALQGIAGQQLQAGGALTGAGFQGLSGAQQAAQNQITASLVPQQLFNQYAAINFGTPAQSYTPNFAGTQSQTTSGFDLNSLLNAGGAFGATKLLASDIQLKENIEYVGEHKGHKLYDFNYRGGKERYRGVMAQDVQKYNPHAVVVGADGYLMVNYDMLGIKMITLKKGQ